MYIIVYHNEVNNLYPSNLAETSNNHFLCFLIALRPLPVYECWPKLTKKLSEVWDRVRHVHPVLQKSRQKVKETSKNDPNIFKSVICTLMWRKKRHLC